MNPKNSSNLPGKIGVKNLASVAGLTERRLYQLSEAGEIPKPENGEFPCRETLLALFRYRRRDPEKLRSEKLAMMTVKREREQLRLGKEAGQLVDAKQCEQLWNSIVRDVREIIQGADIPASTKSALIEAWRTVPLEEYARTFQNDENK